MMPGHEDREDPEKLRELNTSPAAAMMPGHEDREDDPARVNVTPRRPPQ